MSTASDELVSAYLAELEREAARLPWNARSELLEDVRSHIEVAVAEMRDASSPGAESGDSASSDASSADSSSAATTPVDEVSQVRAILAALGEPAEIVAAALADDPSLAPQPSPGTSYPPPGLDIYIPPTRQSPPHPLGNPEIGAVALLLFGGFIFGIGWLVGLALLWNSPRWSAREKLIGTFVLPGGIAGALFAFSAGRSGSSTNCSETGQCVRSGWDPPGWLIVAVVVVSVVVPVLSATYLVRRARLRPGPNATGLAVAIIAGVSLVALMGTFGLLFLTATTTVGTVSPSPEPANSSGGGPISGYVVPVSSPAPAVSSDSGP